MLANDLDALHRMADRIGLRREWFQGDKTFAHYDLTSPKRKAAIAAGAVEIELGEVPYDVLMHVGDGRYERRCDRPGAAVVSEHPPGG
jgi:hypothetical protein